MDSKASLEMQATRAWTLAAEGRAYMRHGFRSSVSIRLEELKGMPVGRSAALNAIVISAIRDMEAWLNNGMLPAIGRESV